MGPQPVEQPGNDAMHLGRARFGYDAYGLDRLRQAIMSLASRRHRRQIWRSGQTLSLQRAVPKSLLLASFTVKRNGPQPGKPRYMLVFHAMGYLRIACVTFQYHFFNCDHSSSTLRSILQNHNPYKHS